MRCRGFTTGADVRGHLGRIESRSKRSVTKNGTGLDIAGEILKGASEDILDFLVR